MPYGDNELLSLRALATELDVPYDRLYRATQNYGKGSTHPIPTPDQSATIGGRVNHQWRRRRLSEWRAWLAEHPLRRRGCGPRSPRRVGTSMQADLVGVLQRRADTLAGTVASLHRVLPDAEFTKVLAQVNTLGAFGVLGIATAAWVNTPDVRARWQRWPPRVRKETAPRARVANPGSGAPLSPQARERNAVRVLHHHRLPRHLAEVKATLERIHRVLLAVPAVDAARLREAFAMAMATYAPKPDDADVPRLLPPLIGEDVEGEGE